MPGELPQATQVFAAVLLDLIQFGLLIPRPPSFSPNLGVGGGGGGGRVDVQVRVSVCE